MTTARSLANTIREVFSTSVRNVGFEYTQMEKAGNSQAILKTIGRAMDCPHCHVTVPANHGHVCTLKAGQWTRKDTPL